MPIKTPITISVILTVILTILIAILSMLGQIILLNGVMNATKGNIALELDSGAMACRSFSRESLYAGWQNFCS